MERYTKKEYNGTLGNIVKHFNKWAYVFLYD